MGVQDPLGTILTTMLEAARQRLTVKPGRVVVVPGNNVPWDDCCEGQLWARIVSIVGVSGLSRPQMQPCLPLYQVRVGLGVVRCAHVINDQGIAPTAAEMTADALKTYQDRIDLVQAVVCDMREIPGVDGLLIEDWLPQGVQGDCVGGELTLTFKHILCTPCEETAP